MTVSLILDGVIAGLLAATIGYAMVLNRKLGEMRNAKAEMEVMVRQFAEATAQAQRGLSDLKVATAQSGDGLQKRVSEARTLSQDLSFLVDKAAGLADRLESQIAAGRGRPTASAERPSRRSEERAEREGAPAAETGAARLRAVDSRRGAGEREAGRAEAGRWEAGLHDIAQREMREGASNDRRAVYEDDGAERKSGARGNQKLMHALRAMR